MSNIKEEKKAKKEISEGERLARWRTTEYLEENGYQGTKVVTENCYLDGWAGLHDRFAGALDAGKQVQCMMCEDYFKKGDIHVAKLNDKGGREAYLPPPIVCLRCMEKALHIEPEAKAKAEEEQPGAPRPSLAELYERFESNTQNWLCQICGKVWDGYYDNQFDLWNGVRNNVCSDCHGDEGGDEKWTLLSDTDDDDKKTKPKGKGKAQKRKRVESESDSDSDGETKAKAKPKAKGKTQKRKRDDSDSDYTEGESESEEEEDESLIPDTCKYCWCYNDPPATRDKSGCSCGCHPWPTKRRKVSKKATAPKPKAKAKSASKPKVKKEKPEAAVIVVED